MMIDNKLKFGDHTKYIGNKISKSIGILFRIRAFVPKPSLRQFYFSFIQSYLQYCILVWGKTYETHLSHLRILQKRSIRIINFKPFLYHSEPLFFHSKILKLDDLFKYNLAIYIHKNSLHLRFQREHDHHTRFRNDLLPEFRRLTTTQQALSSVIPNFCNSLPNYISFVLDLSKFKVDFENFLLTNYSS